MRRFDGSLVLTASDLIGHLACPHLTQLNRGAAAGGLTAPRRRDPELELVARRGEEHERAWLGRFLAAGKRVATVTGDSGSADGLRALEMQTVSAMRTGADIIYQAAFFDGRWHGRADFLVKADVPCALGAWSYEVADAKLARSLRVATLLQMCEYSNHLARLQGRWPAQMHALLGDGRTESFAVQDAAAYHRKVRAQFERAVTDPVTWTYPEPVEHCAVCPWRDTCAERRRTDDHLSLVAGMRRDHMRLLATAGITTVTELGEKIPHVPGIQAATLGRLHAQAALQVRQRADGRLRYELLSADMEGRGLRALPPPSPGDIFFDIEADPYVGQRGLQYLFGVTEVVGGRPVYRAFWAHDPPAERRAFEAVIDLFTERLRDDPGMHVYHYAAYEPAVVRRLSGEHATREDAVDQLLRAGVFVDLYQVVRQGVRVSAESYSLKSIEPLFMPGRSGGIKDAGSSIVAYELWLQDGNPARLEEIADYNQADCESTWRLRDWLETRREEYEKQQGTELDRPAARSGTPSQAAQLMSFESAVLATALAADVPDDPRARTEELEARRLLAGLLDWHRREARPEWLNHFTRLGLTAEELYEDGDALAGLTFLGPVGAHKQSVIHRYAFDPRQDFTIGVGHEPVDPATGQSPGTVININGEAGTIDLLRGPKRQLLPQPDALVPGEPYGTAELRDALFRVGRWVADHGIDDPGPFRAGRDLLLRRPPQVAGLAPGMPLRKEGESAVVAACRAALSLNEGCLPIQGPPGTGKTLTAAHIALALVQTGRRVGVTAMTHKAIGNLLDRICSLAVEQGVPIAAVQRADPGQRCATRWVRSCTDPAQVVQALGAGRVDVVAGTAWLFARSDMVGAVDTLIIDEAGQLSLANVIAVCGAASNLILTGDPQQLSQPSRGSHPEGAANSALEHILAGDKTIPGGRGVFLETTRRMHPDVCSFISGAFYEGRLAAHESCAMQAIIARSPSLSGSGLRYAAVAHEGNRVASSEEAAKVREIFDHLIASEWVDRNGDVHTLREDDILIVAPYNAHVRRLRGVLPPQARVGTVDRFQGQEAPVVIYSMATSNPKDQNRAMGFLYSLRRLNVAVSRAQVQAILVSSPELLHARCRTPAELMQANALCRFVELSEPYV